ncbi:unnamed protein product [Euphydryas editha]|uniref:Uncharacterized protein n=1 Tax=Euphydryas editha TaxID=104508 RepID=A0AAU9TUM7_EUPED|nr:unnamed protein product [Euphydryas editha]
MESTQKTLHGRHRQDLCLNVDKKASNEWLYRGAFYPETEGFMIAIQDQYSLAYPILSSTRCRKLTSSSQLDYSRRRRQYFTWLIIRETYIF